MSPLHGCPAKVIVCIVGSYRWHPVEQTEAAKRLIHEILSDFNPEMDEVISGACPKGGIDIWAINIAKELGFSTRTFPPRKNEWYWFKKRNIAMANYCDIMFRIKSTLSNTNGSGFTIQKAAELEKRTQTYEVTLSGQIIER